MYKNKYRRLKGHTTRNDLKKAAQGGTYCSIYHVLCYGRFYYPEV